MKVAILGATGQNGSSIVNGLLASPETKFEVTALVRPSSLQKSNVQDLQKRGVHILAFDLAGSEDEAVGQLKGIDVLVVCVLTDETPLANMAKKAGVKRYVPCFWATKEATLDHIERLHLPYTIIDVGGTGEVLSTRKDSRDVGFYVARIIADPGTMNRRIFAYTDLRTQNDLWDTVEKLSGEKLERKYRTVEEIEVGVAASQADAMKSMDYFQYTYQRSFDIMGENTPKYARYRGYLIGKELYPDIEGISFEDFVEETIEHGLKPMYEEHADWLRATT